MKARHEFKTLMDYKAYLVIYYFLNHEGSSVESAVSAVEEVCIRLGFREDTLLSEKLKKPASDLQIKDKDGNRAEMVEPDLFGHRVCPIDKVGCSKRVCKDYCTLNK